MQNNLSLYSCSLEYVITPEQSKGMVFLDGKRHSNGTPAGVPPYT